MNKYFNTIKEARIEAGRICRAYPIECLFHQVKIKKSKETGLFYVMYVKDGQWVRS